MHWARLFTRNIEVILHSLKKSFFYIEVKNLTRSPIYLMQRTVYGSLYLRWYYFPSELGNTMPLADVPA